VPRYAVLNDLDTPGREPVALVVERADRVQVLFITDYGLRSEFREPYTVKEPDGEKLIYNPGRPEYFDNVLLTLSRGFLVTKVQDEEKLDTLSALKLFHDEVVAHQPRPPAGEYNQPSPRAAQTRPGARTNGANGATPGHRRTRPLVPRAA
jgi:hypothetical protein